MYFPYIPYVLFWQNTSRANIANKTLAEVNGYSILSHATRAYVW